jgi:hypothetical protein
MTRGWKNIAPCFILATLKRYLWLFLRSYCPTIPPHNLLNFDNGPSKSRYTILKTAGKDNSDLLIVPVNAVEAQLKDVVQNLYNLIVQPFDHQGNATQDAMKREVYVLISLGSPGALPS